jgi:hypothetical protein
LVKGTIGLTPVEAFTLNGSTHPPRLLLLAWSWRGQSSADTAWRMAILVFVQRLGIRAIIPSYNLNGCVLGMISLTLVNRIGVHGISVWWWGAERFG